MLVKQTPFIKLSYFSETELVELEWLAATVDMTVEEFHENVRLQNEVLLEHKPKKILAKTLEMQHTISPDEQEKHNDIILPTFKAIELEKLAIVVSQDLFTQVSISQIVDDDTAAGYQSNYFEDITSAMDWLAE
ncbi:hypothetical protein Fleli_2768 [Bernardetia litoralis DSM 6794]|uniref:Uncharacterized protein n=1 Tax=Bernardetia litoralis (strain ATCC 23117 / DSM 6794 / NBRC 15988 / NCIMB 1366 / Fx l1 / Sio-4) TaxID=880071 RepID=I4AMD6_BERLS|nr:hypothetical protein [Bernardetia litoralis]AFM05121.1 hypothetical protein Fleli_2768 [Bernardetia litoralis DSM 6794]